MIQLRWKQHMILMKERIEKISSLFNAALFKLLTNIEYDKYLKYAHMITEYKLCG